MKHGTMNPRGVKVYVLTSAGPILAIPARRFFGAVNLDTNAQTCNVTFYGAANVNDNASIVAAANALGIGGSTPAIQLPNGIELQEGYLSIACSAAPTGKGIAVYYDLDIR